MTPHFCRTHRRTFLGPHCPECELSARAAHADSDDASEPFAMPDFSSSYDFESSDSSSSSSFDSGSSYDSGSSSSSDFGGGGGFSGGGGGDSF